MSNRLSKVAGSVAGKVGGAIGDVVSDAVGDKIGSSVGGAVAKFDPRKVVDLIDDLWGSRAKIVETVDFVWDNRQPITEAIAFMRDHADDLIDLGRALPALLATAGRALDQAGEGARTASAMLIGDADGEGVRELAADAADALERCQAELWKVMGLLDQAGSSLVALPVIGDAASPLITGAGKVGIVAGDLGSVAQRFRKLGASITDAGTDLGAVGRSLTSSGTTLQQLTTGARTPAASRPAGGAAAPNRQRLRPTAKRITSGRPPNAATRTR